MPWSSTRPEDDGFYWWRLHNHDRATVLDVRSGIAHTPRLSTQSARPLQDLGGEWWDVPLSPPEADEVEIEIERSVALLMEALVSKDASVNAWAAALLKRLKVKLEPSERVQVLALERQAKMIRDNPPPR